jgi:hypothetical protein
VRLPPQSPNLNPNLERFMRSVKEECLERMIFFGERARDPFEPRAPPAAASPSLT